MVDERETAEAINERAAYWVARIDGPGLDDNARAELEAWLGGDTRRRGAFLRAEAAWRMLDRASQLPAGSAEVVAGDQSEWSDFPAAVRSALPRRRVLLVAALAAGIACITLLPALPFLGHDRYSTALGEVRRLPLPDGSLAAINTQSEVKVTLTDDRRAINLERGEAWFQVAKNKARPFLVSAGDVRVQAIGTAFSVRRRDDGVEVQVTEGTVETWSITEPDRRLRLAAGSRTVIGQLGVPHVPPIEASAEIDRSLAWRDGQLIFDGDTLSEAAAEFNRYNERQVVITDPVLSGEKLVGRFRTNEPESFARAAAMTLGAHVFVNGGEIRISRN